MLSRRLAIMGLAAAAAGCATSPPQPASVEPHARLQPLKRFVGRWTGTGQGEPGTSVVERSYTSVLGGRFIEVRHRSTYAAQAANPAGEVHDDVGYLSFDAARRLFVLRQFHVEGFVNQYVSTGFDGPRLVFASEAFENLPASIKARETYVFSGDDAFEEIFEVAEDGVRYDVYSRNQFRRA